MKVLCVDANILISCLSSDEQNAENDILLKALIDKQVMGWAPAHLVSEVTHVLARKKGAGLIDSFSCEEAVRILFLLPLILVWNEELMLKSLIVQEQGIKAIYDASYVALALQKQIPLITADQEILKKGKKVYPAIFTLREWLA